MCFPCFLSLCFLPFVRYRFRRFEQTIKARTHLVISNTWAMFVRKKIANTCCDGRWCRCGIRSDARSVWIRHRHRQSYRLMECFVPKFNIKIRRQWIHWGFVITYFVHILYQNVLDKVYTNSRYFTYTTSQCRACCVRHGRSWVRAPNFHQCLRTHLQVCGSKRLGCHADLYTVGRCCTRGESE